MTKVMCVVWNGWPTTPDDELFVTSSQLYSEASSLLNFPTFLCGLVTTVSPAQLKGGDLSMQDRGQRAAETSGNFRTFSWFLICSDASSSSSIFTSLLRLYPRSPQMEGLHMGLKRRTDGFSIVPGTK